MAKQTGHLNHLYISSQLKFKFQDADKKYGLTEFMNKKVFRVSDTPLSYRQVNTLDKDNLLGENREGLRTWREFSAKELVYILIVVDLKKFGLAHSKLRELWATFFKEPGTVGRLSTIDQLQGYKSVAETAIGCVFGGVEIVLVFTSNGSVTFYDPESYTSHMYTLKTIAPAYIRLTLNPYVNRTLDMMKQTPFAAHWSASEEYIQRSTISGPLP